jgi:OOP family OmpA-OmpF porin
MGTTPQGTLCEAQLPCTMNILSLIQSQLSPQTVGQISNAVGESPEGTKAALGTAFPALLGSLVGKANASPSGVTDIFNMVKQGQSQGGWSDTISSVIGGLSGGTAGAEQPAHQSILNSLLGSKLGAVTDFIASRCGIRGGSAGSLLGMAAPLLMGIIGKQVSSQGLGAAGLGQLLSSQTQYLKDALPSGLANTLGIGSLLSGTHDTQRVETPFKARGSNVLKWASVALVLALAGWFFANRSHKTTPADMGGTTGRTEVTTGRSWQTPDFSNLSLTSGGIADRMAKAITAGDWNKAIDLQGWSFDSTGELADSAKGDIKEIGQVLSSAPSVKLQITGYGETEEAGLSRANGIKSSLIAEGVAESRIATRGQVGAGTPTVNLMR